MCLLLPLPVPIIMIYLAIVFKCVCEENLAFCKCTFALLAADCACFYSIAKVKNKGPDDIMAVEDMNGEVKFSTHLPYPNNLSK